MDVPKSILNERLTPLCSVFRLLELPGELVLRIISITVGGQGPIRVPDRSHSHKAREGVSWDPTSLFVVSKDFYSVASLAFYRLRVVYVDDEQFLNLPTSLLLYITNLYLNIMVPKLDLFPDDCDEYTCVQFVKRLEKCPRLARLVIEINYEGLVVTTDFWDLLPDTFKAPSSLANVEVKPGAEYITWYREGEEALDCLQRLLSSRAPSLPPADDRHNSSS